MAENRAKSALHGLPVVQADAKAVGSLVKAGFPDKNYLEVYLGGQWLRVDGDIGIYCQAPGLYLKILSVADWSEVDFTETWHVDWIHERPFYTLVLEDQEPKH